MPAIRLAALKSRFKVVWLRTSVFACWPDQAAVASVKKKGEGAGEGNPLVNTFLSVTARSRMRRQGCSSDIQPSAEMSSNAYFAECSCDYKHRWHCRQQWNQGISLECVKKKDRTEGSCPFFLYRSMVSKHPLMGTVAIVVLHRLNTRLRATADPIRVAAQSGRESRDR